MAPSYPLPTSAETSSLRREAPVRRAAAAPGSEIRLSIIVPVYNDPGNLRESLAALSAAATPGSEIIVVDDGSIDDTPEVAARAGVRLLRLSVNSGPAAARNHGARHARGEILLFVDADVVVAPDAVRRVLATFDAQPDVAAVFGSYDASPRAPGLVSQYRNLLHHFVHQQGNPEASTFWAGCGAVRQRVFEAMGGFDATRFRRPSMEDIELGYRLREAGHRIVLDKRLQATHLKAWTLRSTITTDVMARAVPWSRLLLERKSAPRDLNLKTGQQASVALVMLATLCLGLAPLRPVLGAIGLVALLAVVVANRTLYAFFRRERGAAFAATCIPLHLLYYLYGGLSYLAVWLQLRGTGALRRLGPVRETVLARLGSRTVPDPIGRARGQRPPAGAWRRVRGATARQSATISRGATTRSQSRRAP